MIKRILSLILAAGLLLALCACDGGGGASGGVSSVTSKPTEPDEPTTLLQRQPAKLGNMAMQSMFYHPQQADTVYLVDITHATKGEVATLRCLQGLVARNSSAAIYLYSDEVDLHWRDYLTAEYGVYFTAADTAKLLQVFADCYSGVAVYGSGDYEFVLAACLAGQTDRVIMSRAVYEQHADLFRQEEVLQVSGLATTADEAYDYIYSNLLTKANKNYVALCNEQTPFLDYIIASGCLCVDSMQRLMTAARHVAACVDAQLPAVAFLDEQPAADTLAELSGIGFSAMDINSLTNTTLFSSVQVRQIDAYTTSPALGAEAGNVYVAITLAADGVHTPQQEVTALWNERSSITRVSTEFCPALYELAPVIVNWYMLNCTSTDNLVAPHCGWSAVDAGKMPEQYYNQWNMLNNYFLQACGIRTVANCVVSSAEQLEIIGKDSVAEGFVVPHKVLQAADKTAELPAAVGYVDIATIEGLTEWLSGLQADEAAPQFYVVRLQPNEYDAEIYRQIDAVAANANLASGGIFKFVMVDDLIVAQK